MADLGTFRRELAPRTRLSDHSLADFRVSQMQQQRRRQSLDKGEKEKEKKRKGRERETKEKEDSREA